MATLSTIFTLDGYLSTRVAAKVTGYSPRMLRHLIESGDLQADRKGKRAWRIKVSDIRSCLQDRYRSGKCRKAHG
jgi:hypothetical protein